MAVISSADKLRTASTRFAWTTSSSLRTDWTRSEEHTSELQSLRHLVCRLLLEKKNLEAWPPARAGQLRGPRRPGPHRRPARRAPSSRDVRLRHTGEPPRLVQHAEPGGGRDGK